MTPILIPYGRPLRYLWNNFVWLPMLLNLWFEWLGVLIVMVTTFFFTMFNSILFTSKITFTKVG